MKKVLITLLAATGLLLTGCEGPMGPMGPQGNSAYTDSAYFTVSPSQWTAKQDAYGVLYWYVVYDLPFMDAYTFDNGMYVAYVVDGDVQQPIPVEIFNSQDGTPWQRQIWCDFGAPTNGSSVGNVAFYVQDSDFVNALPADPITFRVVAWWD